MLCNRKQLRVVKHGGKIREGLKIVTVDSTKSNSSQKSLAQTIRSLVPGTGDFVRVMVTLLLCGFPALAQSQQPPIVPEAQNVHQDAPATVPAVSQQRADQQSSGSISGTVVDASGGVVAGARVKLTAENLSASQETLTGSDGQFSFANIPPGPFRLTIALAGFATQTSSGVLQLGESHVVPQIALAVATAVTEVRVGPSWTKVAEEQIKEQEKQRVLGVIPNFYVTYIPNAVPLNSKQKFELAWKFTLDPVSFAMVGAVAGIEQAANQFGGYGQGAEGYGKRYGASFADAAIGNFIGGAILPSVLKQDPRYFYKGTGSKRSRFMYAIATAVICKGDNGHWQPNYSSILGNLAAGGISNLYYPSNDRNGVGLTFESALIGIGTGAATNLLQEFLIRKLTPSASNRNPPKP